MFILTAEDFACFTGKSTKASDRRHGLLASLTVPTLLTRTVTMRAASLLVLESPLARLQNYTSPSSVDVLLHEWCMTLNTQVGGSPDKYKNTPGNNFAVTAYPQILRFQSSPVQWLVVQWQAHPGQLQSLTSWWAKLIKWDCVTLWTVLNLLVALFTTPAKQAAPTAYPVQLGTSHRRTAHSTPVSPVLQVRVFVLVL